MLFSVMIPAPNDSLLARALMKQYRKFTWSAPLLFRLLSAYCTTHPHVSSAFPKESHTPTWSDRTHTNCSSSSTSGSCSVNCNCSLARAGKLVQVHVLEKLSGLIKTGGRGWLSDANSYCRCFIQAAATLCGVVAEIEHWVICNFNQSCLHSGHWIAAH